VKINDKLAYISYVSPTQLNVETPGDTGTGSATVTVTTAAGSSGVAVASSSVMPGLFTVSNYVIAVRPGDSVIINGTGAAVPGYSTAAAAQPGDILEVYATGLGETAPAVAAGLVFQGDSPTTTRPTVTIGGLAAEVSYCGLFGAGLYQINLAVPSALTAETHAVVVTQVAPRRSPALY
jgi:uncharacterized protein (TIGR03437 family)